MANDDSGSDLKDGFNLGAQDNASLYNLQHASESRLNQNLDRTGAQTVSNAPFGIEDAANNVDSSLQINSLQDEWERAEIRELQRQQDLASSSTSTASQSLFTPNEFTQEQFQQLMNRYDLQATLDNTTNNQIPIHDKMYRGISSSSNALEYPISHTSLPLNQADDSWAWLSGHDQQQDHIPLHFQEPNSDPDPDLDATASPQPSDTPVLEVSMKRKEKANAPIQLQVYSAKVDEDTEKREIEITARRRSDGDYIRNRFKLTSIPSKGNDIVLSADEASLVDEDEEEDDKDGGANNGSKIRKVSIPCRSSSDSESPQFKIRHVCPYKHCSKDFSTSGHARRHSRIHDEFRQYGCPHPGCKALFTRKDNCKQHQKNSHGDILDAVKFRKEQAS